MYSSQLSCVPPLSAPWVAAAEIYTAVARNPFLDPKLRDIGGAAARFHWNIARSLGADINGIELTVVSSRGERSGPRANPKLELVVGGSR